MVSLADLVEAPARTAEIEPDAVPALLGELEEVRALLWARLTVPSRPSRASLEPYTLPEAARLLGRSAAWVRRKAKAGEIPCARRSGRAWRFPRDTFDRFCTTRDIG